MLSVNDLRPVRRTRVGEQPASVVFGFNNKDAETGHQNMVDLGGPIFDGKRDIVKEVISG